MLRKLKSPNALDSALIALLLFAFCLRIWDFGVVYHDDARWVVDAFTPGADPAGGWARAQGRLYAFPYGALMLHAHRWLGTAYGEVLRIGSFAAFFCAFHVFVRVYVGRRIAILSACFFLALFAMRWEASWLTGGPLAPWVMGSAFIASVLLARSYVMIGGIAFAVGSGVCLFASFFINEGVAVMFGALFLLALLWSTAECRGSQQSLYELPSELVSSIRPRITLIVFGIAVVGYVVASRQWALAHPTRYDGHVLAPFDIYRIAVTTLQFLTSNSIIRDFIQPYAVAFGDVMADTRTVVG
jgi:hypothetical protein